MFVEEGCSICEEGLLVLLLFPEGSELISSGSSTFAKYGWVRILEAVILLEGSHLSISARRLIPSGGQFGITYARGIAGNYGKV